MGGFLLSLGWDLSTVFAVAAAPALLAAVAMFAKGRLGRPVPKVAAILGEQADGHGSSV